ncbi:MAG: hypothetical protein GY931_21470, partial [Maribacter sp.]|nr:hypothetical protein [Maribacter sp.]
SVAFSPDGKYVLTGSTDKTAKLWDLKGKVIQPFLGHEGRIYSVAFSPDGKYALTGSLDNTAKLWDLKGNEIQSFKGHDDDVYSVAFSPDGKSVLTGSADKTAKLWDLKGNEIQSFNGHTNGIWKAVFSPDGQFVLTGCWDATVKYWNIDGNEILSLKAHPTGTYGTYGVAFSHHDSRLILSGGDDNKAKLWDLNKANLDMEKAYSGDGIPPLTFSQKIEFDTLELDDVLSVKEDSQLIEGAEYFRQKLSYEGVQYLKDKYSRNMESIIKHLMERVQKSPNNVNYKTYVFL